MKYFILIPAALWLCLTSFANAQDPQTPPWQDHAQQASVLEGASASAHAARPGCTQTQTLKSGTGTSVTAVSSFYLAFPFCGQPCITSEDCSAPGCECQFGTCVSFITLQKK